MSASVRRGIYKGIDAEGVEWAIPFAEGRTWLLSGKGRRLDGFVSIAKSCTEVTKLSTLMRRRAPEPPPPPRGEGGPPPSGGSGS